MEFVQGIVILILIGTAIVIVIGKMKGAPNPSSISEPVKPNNTLPSPYEVGIILAISLVEGRSPDDIAANELVLVEEAGVSRPDYVVERFLLFASAAAHAAGAYLQPHQRKDVAAGFMSWFEQNASSSKVFANTYQLFKERLPTYIEAGCRDLQQFPTEPNQVWFSQVSYTFGDALVSKSTKGSTGEFNCRLLSMALCDAYWSAQVDGSVMLFKRAGLIK